VLALGLLPAGLTGLTGAAVAAPARDTAADACLPGDGHGVDGEQHDAKTSRDKAGHAGEGVASRSSGLQHDGHSFSAAERARIQRALEGALAERAAQRGSAGSRLETTVTIDVHAHVVGTRSKRGPSRDRVLRQVNVMNRAFQAQQSAQGAATSYVFRLASYDRVRNARWHTAGPGSAANTAMRRALKRGGADDLNLYFHRPQLPGGPVLLGFATFPWDVARFPRVDGVSLHLGSLPGGNLRGFDRGDTATHEVGHWLGLFHTFEGQRCRGAGDEVEDTPLQKTPSSTCKGTEDSCPLAPGNDPVFNFMDYSPDSCMNQFTPGQVLRMDTNWLAFRDRTT
jgi:hypothetical protein